MAQYRSVCRCRQSVVEQPELFLQPLMCGLSFSRMLKTSLPALFNGSRFPSIRTNLSGLSRPSGHTDVMSFFLPFCKEKRNEYLLVERILQFVILYVVPLLRPFPLT